MTTTPPAPLPYGSVRDLPSFQKMKSELAAFKILGVFASRETRKEMKRVERELERITVMVDSFYALLGNRNWVFTGDLRTSEVPQVIDTADPAEAEQRLIAYYKRDDHLSFPVRQLNRFAAMRPRLELVRKALDDYHAGRYYSTVLVLLAVMDGFVNDCETEQRKGLHARSDDEMVAWDSVVGHHLGLSHAHKSFKKRFQKTGNDPTEELFRNGIMHGMLTNFDNEVVATKAWNRLFAVADWADARVQQAKPIEPTPKLGEVLKRSAEISARGKRIEQWKAHDYSVDPAAEEQSEVVATCMAFLGQWQKRQYGPLGDHFLDFSKERKPPSARAREARDLFAAFELTSSQVRHARHVAAAVAELEVELSVNGLTQITTLRWLRVDEQNQTATEWEEGRWTLSPYGPTTFLAESQPSSAKFEPNE